MTESQPHRAGNSECGERRQSSRYAISGAAWFQWQTVEGTWREGSGVTRDMGKAGTFIETDDVPPVTTRLRVTVTFPIGAHDDVQVRLCGSGDVRHVQREQKGAGGYGAWVPFRTEAPESRA
jgi:hypothetical protein